MNMFCFFFFITKSLSTSVNTEVLHQRNGCVRVYVLKFNFIKKKKIEREREKRHTKRYCRVVGAVYCTINVQNKSNTKK